MIADDADAPTATDAKPWWEGRWAPLGIGLGIGACLIVADDYGYGGVFEWGIAFVCGTGIAVAAFWARRKAPWFWPAIILLIVAHAIALATHHWRMLPHYPMGTAVQLKGAIALDFAVSGLFLLCSHLLFDPKVGPKAHLATPAKIAISVLVLIILGVGGFTTAAIIQSSNRKVALSRVVFTVRTDRTVDELTNCLNDYAAENDEWDDVAGGETGKQFFYAIRGRTERVIDRGSYRLVQILTVNGRPLEPDERSFAVKCLA